MNGYRPLLLSALLAGSILSIGAGPQAMQDNVEPKVSLLQTKIITRPGGNLTVFVKVTFAEGLHGYQNPPADEFQVPVSVKVVSGEVKLVKAAYPLGKELKMQGEDKPLKVYSGTISIPVTLKVGKKGGPFTLAVAYQQCTDRNCYPPSQVVVKGNAVVNKKPSKAVKN